MAILSADGRRVVRILGRAKACCALLAVLCRRTGWPEDRTLDVVAGLHAAGWVAVAESPPAVRLTPWSRAWVARERPQLALELLPTMDTFPDRLFPYPDEADHVRLGGCGTERERHRDGCDCETCRLPVSATQPQPSWACPVCRGYGPGAGWICLGCHRRDFEEAAPPLPYVRPQTQPAKGDIEVNTKRPKRRRRA